MNGYLLFIPLIISIGVLISISILALSRRAGFMNFIYEWIFITLLMIVALLFIKFV